jgi:probable FeS assembly SUF system protein SufT
MNESVQLLRDVAAVQIPSGNEINLLRGTEVVITQSLGGSYTVHASGGLFRIANHDADALGKPILEEQAPAAAGELTEDRVREVLKTCYDPEIPVNIVDLGLIYSLELTPDGDRKKVLVKMTLTAPGCGMGPSIAADAKAKILHLPGVSSAEVELVWEPPWNPGMISTEGKMKLGIE